MPSGDNWFLPHSQLDASLTVEPRSDVSLQVSGLNLNNAVFGFYSGNSRAKFSGQREYHGRSVIIKKFSFRSRLGKGVRPVPLQRHDAGDPRPR